MPSAEEVQPAAPSGRADPFGPLVGVEAADAPALTTGLPKVMGVLLVGDQNRAMVITPSGSGVICVGVDGRCGEDAPLFSERMVGAQHRCGDRLHSPGAER